jgi:hypothetical protein
MNNTLTTSSYFKKMKELNKEKEDRVNELVESSKINWLHHWKITYLVLPTPI